MAALLSATGLGRRFVRGPQEIWAVRDVNLSVASGEILCVWGRSGSGKTTLLNLLGALDRPTTGTVCLDGRDLGTMGPADLLRVRRERIGFIFQQFHLIPHLTAVENVALPLQYAGLHRRERHQRAAEMLELVGLRDRRHFLWDQLSGGEAQRVAIARALVPGPQVVLADEPTGELDSISAGELVSLIRRLNAELGQTFVLATHDRDLAAVAHRTLEMRDGRLLEENHAAPSE